MTVYATQEKSEWGRKERKIEVESCRRQTARRRMRKEESGDQRKGENEWYLDARQRAQSRRERQGSVSDGKGVE